MLDLDALCFPPPGRSVCACQTERETSISIVALGRGAGGGGGVSQTHIHTYTITALEPPHTCIHICSQLITTSERAIHQSSELLKGWMEPNSLQSELLDFPLVTPCVPV